MTAGLASVAVRVPAHPVAYALLAACGIPVAAPSANRSMMLSPTTGEHVAKSLGDAVDLILDAGPTDGGNRVDSDRSDDALRQRCCVRGRFRCRQIEAVGGAIGTAPAFGAGVARPSPGMLDRHYSPRARLVLVDHSGCGVRDRRERHRGQRVGARVRRSLGVAAPTCTTRLCRRCRGLRDATLRRAARARRRRMRRRSSSSAYRPRRSGSACATDWTRAARR